MDGVVVPFVGGISQCGRKHRANEDRIFFSTLPAALGSSPEAETFSFSDMLSMKPDDILPEEVVLANSASYGLHVIASAYPWKAGDEILVVAGDFPVNILPWLLVQRNQGVRVVRLRPKAHLPSPDELTAALTPRTRLFCTSWVQDCFSREGSMGRPKE